MKLLMEHSHLHAATQHNSTNQVQIHSRNTYDADMAHVGMSWPTLIWPQHTITNQDMLVQSFTSRHDWSKQLSLAACPSFLD